MVASNVMPVLHVHMGTAGSSIQLPSLDLVNLLSLSPPSWFKDCNSWTVFAIASVTLYWYTRNFPPGPSFTYAWLWVGLLSTLFQNVDASALFYLIGFGLVTGWYTTQILQRDIWDRLLVYWLKIWPSWCVSSMVRVGDVIIHILPFAYSLQFYDHVTLKHVFQAILYERIYFYSIEGSIIGSGRVANTIYALHPPCGPHTFRSIQMLSTVGYFFASTVCAGSTGRQFLKALWLSLYVFIACGSVGYFDHVRLPKDTEFIINILNEWEEVNGKVATYIQSLRDVVTQSMFAQVDAPSDPPMISPDLLAMLLMRGTESPTESLHSSSSKDEKPIVRTVKYQPTGKSRWRSHSPAFILRDEPKAAYHTPKLKRRLDDDHRRRAESVESPWTTTSTAASSADRVSVQSLAKKIRNLESIVNKLKNSQNQELVRISSWHIAKQRLSKRTRLARATSTISTMAATSTRADTLFESSSNRDDDDFSIQSSPVSTH
eukprot:Blabericola_migrator_1__4740@NODE_249_length_10888_cov_100_919231_g210_i0_p3_GENE_NODE_249_length_10888_cov_100_919231_g210_i0NODE_249_length_10888_cov_100_919231_g210_i0_p3_ORF_typecomplete_len489_score50_77Phage_tail_APC/PF16778_5/0_16_NODE_249_length_10888_cov_100_919231_g210_i074938959